jgi:hypothetical protein
MDEFPHLSAEPLGQPEAAQGIRGPLVGPQARGHSGDERGCRLRAMAEYALARLLTNPNPFQPPVPCQPVLADRPPLRAGLVLHEIKLMATA